MEQYQHRTIKGNNMKKNRNLMDKRIENEKGF